MAKKQKSPPKRLRIIGVAVVGLAISLPIAIGFSTWQDLTLRQEAVAALEESERMALGRDTPSPSNFAPIGVVGRPSPLTKFSIYSPEDSEYLPEDDEIVLAVVVNGEARAYALNMLTGPEREILNDELGGQAIAATW